MAIRFLYFDLGNVLLGFSNERSCAQLAELAGIDYDQVARFVLGPHVGRSLLWQFECGQMSEHDFFDAVCDQLGSRLDRTEFDIAASDMFTPMPESFDLVERLSRAGHRLGILSNTNPIHWQFLTDGRWPVLNSAFELHVTSFGAQSMKPDRGIYDQAIEKAGVEAHEVFFVDDRSENVAGAMAVGIDAVQYVDHHTLVADLQARGINA